jgi:hypothetical protein
MDLQEILDDLESIRAELTEHQDLERGRLHAVFLLGELMGQLSMQVEAEKAFAEAEETEGAPV